MMDHIYYGGSEVRYEAIHDFLGDPGSGAHLVFLGVVRRQNMGKEVVAIEYDVFSPLAHATTAELFQICRKNWGGELRLFVHHRVGRIEADTPCIGIGVSSRHRDEAYRASRFLIDEIKHRVPVWKREIYSDGESEWLPGCSLCSEVKSL